MVWCECPFNAQLIRMFCPQTEVIEVDKEDAPADAPDATLEEPLPEASESEEVVIMVRATENGVLTHVDAEVTVSAKDCIRLKWVCSRGHCTHSTCRLGVITQTEGFGRPQPSPRHAGLLMEQKKIAEPHCTETKS